MPRNYPLAVENAQAFVDCFCECGHPDSEHLRLSKGRDECRPGTTNEPEECSCRKFRKAPLKVIVST